MYQPPKLLSRVTHTLATGKRKQGKVVFVHPSGKWYLAEFPKGIREAFISKPTPYDGPFKTKGRYK